MSGSTAAAIDLTTPPREATRPPGAPNQLRSVPGLRRRGSQSEPGDHPLPIRAEPRQRRWFPLLRGGSAGHAVSSLALLGAGLIGLGLIRRRCA